MVLLPLVGGLYYVLVLRPHSIAADGGADGRGRTSDAAFIVAAQPSTALAPSPPPDWSHQWQSASFRQIQLHPALFVAIDLGGLVVIFVLVLFEASLQRAYYEWRSRARGYQSLDPIDTPAPRGQVGGVGGAEENDERIKPVRMMRAATLRREMAKAVDASESLELQMRMQQRTSEDSIGEPATPPRKTANAAANGNAVDAATAAADATATTADATAKPLAAVVPTAADACASPIDGSHEGAALRHALRKQLARRSRLQTALQRNASFASSPERARQSVDNASWCARLASSTFVKVFRRSTNGLITVWLYFADVLSDIEVMLLLHSAGMLPYALIAGTLLVIQFVAVYARVLPYLRSTFGADAAIYYIFLWGGFPCGMIALDCFMFLEPFGLLSVVPMPERMRQFIPAYKSTRITAEVLMESLPQCLLQSYILITVMHHVTAGTATMSERALLNAGIEGSTFEQILPRSIAISTLTMLKAWIELVHSAREAGISVRTKIVQLLHVGFGLPLDALKKGTLLEWSCSHYLADGEVTPLLDALIKNSSLLRLNLADAGLDWSGPEASKKRSGAPLVEALAARPATLAELQRLVVSPDTGYEIPIAQLRRGGERALQALQGVRLLRADGPRRTEILLMSDMLRKNRRVTAVAASDVEHSAQAVMSLLESARRGEVSMDTWEARVKEMLVGGETRRAHFRSLFAASALRDVGFSASALLAADYTAEELHEGRFLAAEMRDAGLDLAALHGLGYGARELRAAGFSAALLWQLSYTAARLREAEYTAADLYAAGYPLREMCDAGYPTADLKAVGFGASDLRAVGVGATELRDSKAFTGRELREGGFTAAAMRDGGFDAKRALAAGYDAVEATEGGWTLEQLKAAGYECAGLRRAGWQATAMRAAGFSLDQLRQAKYSPAELQTAGFDAATLKEAGTTLFQLRQANTPVATLRAAGYKAERLKVEGYSAKELADGGYLAKELRGFRDMLYVEGESYAGFTAAELWQGRVAYSSEELKASGYVASELREGGWPAHVLRSKGFTASELHAAHYGAKELLDGGFDLATLKAIGHTAATLHPIGVPAGELRRVGFSVAELRKAGLDAAQLQAVHATPAELKDGGYSPAELAAVGCGLDTLRAVGFTADDMRGAGYAPKALLDHGYSCAELGAGGFEQRQVDALDGRSTRELRAEGYAVRELKAVGFSAAEVRAGGYTCLDMKLQGFENKALKDAGFKARAIAAVGGTPTPELRSKGYTAEELQGAGFSSSALLEGGFATRELKDIGFSAAELKAAGSTAGQLKEGGFVCKQLRAAGFTLRELREGGFAWKELVIFLRCTHAELVRAGYEGIDPKDLLFKQYRPEGAATGADKPAGAAGTTDKPPNASAPPVVATAARHAAKIAVGCHVAVRAPAAAQARTLSFAPAGSSDVGHFYICDATSKPYELKKAEPRSDWGKLPAGTRVFKATHTNNVGAVFYGDPNHSLRWYTSNRHEIVIPLEQVLHAGFVMEAATLPPRGQEGWDIEDQRQAVNQGAVALSDADHQVIMQALPLLPQR